jgi:hypothetical protein
VTASWSAPTSFDVVCRRAAGRRAYNAQRQFNQRLRRIEVARLLKEWGGLKRGTVRRLAAHLNIHRKTAGKDVLAILCTHSSCPTCGALVPKDRLKRLGARPV